MTNKHLLILFSIASLAGVAWGVLFAFFGLGVVPLFNIDILIPWGNGVYGATLIGLCTTFFFAGRHALRIHDTELLKALLYGLCAWLFVEGAFSLYYRVFLNVGVDIGVLLLLGYPLIKGITKK